MWICSMLLILPFKSVSSATPNCSFGRAGELEMRLRRIEMGRLGGVGELGELGGLGGQDGMLRGEEVGDNLEVMEDDEEGERMRRRRSIFMRDNVALARSICKIFIQF